MKYAELVKKAERYLATFPNQSPVDIYINGFLAGYRERDGEEQAPAAARDAVKEALERYNTTCKDFGRVRALSDKRRTKLRIRLEEMAMVGEPLEVIQQVFDKMQASSFLKGQNPRGWKATFDWLLINDTNWLKIYEGQYDDKAGTPDQKKVNDYWDK
jgi:succinate dehydrogenase/fumarate reductase flavoprotein subunit